MTAPSAKKILKRVEHATSIKDAYQPVWQDIIDYMLPMFDNFYDTELSGGHPMDRIYDSEPVRGAMEFASRLVSGLFPLHERGFVFEPGDTVPQDQADEIQPALEQVADYVWQRMVESNFSAAIENAALNLGIGTCNIAVEEGIIADRPLRYRSYYHPEVLVDLGPTGEPDGVFVPMEKCWEDLEVLYPGIKKPSTIAEIKDDTKICVLDSTVRDWKNRGDEVHYRQVVLKTDNNTDSEVLWEETIRGVNSKPVITARWSGSTMTAWGRGPFVFALPDTKSLNYVQELIFNNAEMAIAGVWQYEDDGTLNADNIELTPGTLIPKRRGSSGLEPLTSPSQFDVSQFLLLDQRASVSSTLYNRQFGPVGKTPLSATEINERQVDLVEVIGLSIVNLIRELVIPLITRSAFILRKRGLIKLPKINGQEVRIRVTSPLAKALQQGKIVEFSNFLNVVSQFMGPQALAVYVNLEEAVKDLAEWHNVHTKNLRTKAQQQKFVSELRDAFEEAPTAEAA